MYSEQDKSAQIRRNVRHVTIIARDLLSISTKRLAKSMRDFVRGLPPLHFYLHKRSSFYIFRRAQIVANGRARTENARRASERQLHQLYAASYQRIPVRRAYTATKTSRIHNYPLRHRYLSLFITCHCLWRLFRSLY